MSARDLRQHVAAERLRWALLASALADLHNYAVVLERHIGAKAATNRSSELERELARKLGALFDELGQEVLAQLRQAGRAPSAPDSKARLRNTIARVLDDMADRVEPEILEAAQHGRNRIANALRRAGMSIELDEMPSSTAERLREHVFESSRRTAARVDATIMDRLARAEEKGWGIDDIADDLQERFASLSDGDARRIARTEVNGAQNEGAYETERELNVDYHEWTTAEDDRVRGLDPDDEGDHASLHGVIVRVGDPFPNGLTYPGERQGAEYEWINCRCRVVPFLMPEGKRAPSGMDHFTAGDLRDDA